MMASEPFVEGDPVEHDSLIPAVSPRQFLMAGVNMQMLWNNADVNGLFQTGWNARSRNCCKVSREDLCDDPAPLPVKLQSLFGFDGHQ